MRIAVCDADPSFSGILEKTLIDLKLEIGLDVEYYKREDSHDIEELCGKYGHMDLIFMALHPKRGPDGYYIARRLKEVDKNLNVVFVAADKLVDPEIMNLQPFGFLPLPADEGKIKAFARECSILSQNQFIFKKDQSYTAVPAGQICFIRKERPDHRKSFIYCADGRTYDTYMSVTEVVNELRRISMRNIRIANSCFVNPFFIRFMNKTELFIREDCSCTIKKLSPSRGFRIKAFEAYKEYCGSDIDRLGIAQYTL